jgi:hypothetical protein
MDEKNEKAVKNRISQPSPPVLWEGAVVWCGDGPRRLLLYIVFFLGQVEFGCKAKSTGRNHLVA